eukprot:2823512-Rhodomonas_salina.2
MFSGRQSGSNVHHLPPPDNISLCQCHDIKNAKDDEGQSHLRVILAILRQVFKLLGVIGLSGSGCQRFIA